MALALQQHVFVLCENQRPIKYATYGSKERI
jgi:hypothetical protein